MSCRGTHFPPIGTSLAEELPVGENPDHRFLAVLGQHRHLHLAFLDEEDGVGDVALAVDLLVFRVPLDGFSKPRPAHKSPRIKTARYINMSRVGHRVPPS